MDEPLFINYLGKRIFVVPIAGSREKSIFYYPKGDAFILLQGGTLSVREGEIIGNGSAVLIAEEEMSLQEVSKRAVTWNVFGTEVEGDNLFIVNEGVSYEDIWDNVYPNRAKSFVINDGDPKEYGEWCCVVVIGKKDREVPASFKKVRINREKTVEVCE
ncbi:hypothetical protein HS7_02770 [Sulfolobales archaeon HS-7]|nr:hypothetical protein HS7_02770 [Sulfolobales archaeon HS-7]